MPYVRSASSVPAAPAATYVRLTPAFQRLVTLMQSVRFGRIEHLLVRGGEPVFSPPPRLLRTFKMGAPDAVATPAQNFALKRQVIELVQQLTRLGDGRVEHIEIAHGLPLKLVIEDPSFGS